MADIWRRFRELPGRIQVVAVLVVIGAAGSLMDDESVPEQRPDETQAESDLFRDESLPANQATMSRSDDEWPLTVEEGIVSCEGAGEVYFMAEGRRHAVNGLAIGARRRRRSMRSGPMILRWKV